MGAAAAVNSVMNSGPVRRSGLSDLGEAGSAQQGRRGFAGAGNSASLRVHGIEAHRKKPGGFK
jgi:hypothetical protein